MVNDDLAIETRDAAVLLGRARLDGSWRRQDDVVPLHLRAVHLDEALVQGLLALVVILPGLRRGKAGNVDLVHEDDAQSVLLPVQKDRITRRTDTDETHP